MYPLYVFWWEDKISSLQETASLDNSFKVFWNKVEQKNEAMAEQGCGLEERF